MDITILVPWLLALILAGVAFWLWRRSQLSSAAKQAKQTAPSTAASRYAARVLENCDDVAWLFDLDSQRLLYISPSIEWLRGWKVDELVGKPAKELNAPTGMEKLRAMVEDMKKAHAEGKTNLPAMRLEVDVPLKEGGVLPVETEYKLLSDDNGNPTLLLGVSRDISERRRLEQGLRDAEERVRLALHCSGDGVWDINLQSGEMGYLDGWEGVLGYGKSDIEPNFEGYLQLVHTDDVSKLRNELDRHIKGEVPTFQCEFRMRTKDGGWRWVLSRGMLWSHSADGEPLRMIGTHTDITSRKVAEVAMSRTNVKLHSQIDEIRALQTQLAEQAVRDPLTGLYNRRYLDETLEREVARARREGHPLSVVMLDVDYFKKLNDSYGHQAGDEVLKALADLLRENTRMEDVACRYGGEEFLVLLPSMPLDKACERAEHWRSQLEQHKFGFGNFSLSVTASFGVSGYPHQGKTPDDLTRAADAALYSAKRKGRNRVEMLDEDPIVFVTGNPNTGT